MNKNQILTIDIQISQMNEAQVYFNRGKIKDWEAKYGGLARIYRKEVNAIQEEYFVLENGQIKTEGEGADRKFVCKEGKTIEGYSEAFSKWGNREV